MILCDVKIGTLDNIEHLSVTTDMTEVPDKTRVLPVLDISGWAHPPLGKKA
jgi:hypothetical protein